MYGGLIPTPLCLSSTNLYIYNVKGNALSSTNPLVARKKWNRKYSPASLACWVGYEFSHFVVPLFRWFWATRKEWIRAYNSNFLLWSFFQLEVTLFPQFFVGFVKRIPIEEGISPINILSFLLLFSLWLRYSSVNVWTNIDIALRSNQMLIALIYMLQTSR